VSALILRRLALAVPIVLLVSFAVFSLALLLPGDPAVAIAGGADASPERIAEIRAELRLDDPFLVQYGRWLGNAVRLDFGRSLISGRPVAEDLLVKLPVTLSVGAVAVLFALLVSIPGGILAGMRPGSVWDRGIVLSTNLGIAIPSFWLALMLVLVFAVQLGWLPVLGYSRWSESPQDWLRHLVLPAVALSTRMAASLTRQLRAALAEVLSSNYVRTAWAKGATTRRVLIVHALKNSALPAITILGLQMSTLVGGSVIIEQIFGLPGMGSFALRGILSRDLPVIQAVTLVYAVVHVGANLLVDLSYGLLNPKVRVS
jgi:peptide/nickel transport system permease protein